MSLLPHVHTSSRPYLVVLLFVLGAPALAQLISVQAFVDKTTLGDAERVLYTVEVRGPIDNLGALEAPPTRGLVARQGNPVQRWDVTTRGTRTEHVLRLQWQFDPLRPGDAEIGRATIVIDGRRYTTDPIRLRVVSQSQRPPPSTWDPLPPGRPRADAFPSGPPDLFLQAAPPRTSAFVGQQVVVEHVIHFAPEVQPRNARITRAWDATGFWREDLELPRTPEVHARTIEGQPYDAVTLKRTAFFPTRSGLLTVDSLYVEVDVLRAYQAGGGRGVYNPFGGRHRRETVAAAPVRVEVRPLPAGAPDAFGGAVGAFEMEVEADRVQVGAGEPVRLTVTLRGNGNMATLAPPDWEPPPSFEQYPPQEDAEVDRAGRRLQGERRFTYTLVPRSGGTFELPPLVWAYFDPEAEQYRTLTSDPLPLRVIGPAAPLAERGPGAEAPLRVDAEPGTWHRIRPATPIYRHPLAIAGFTLPLLALAALALVRYARDRQPDDSPVARSLRAHPEAAAALREAERLREAPPPPAYYATLEGALRRFLSDRLGVPAALSQAEIAEALDSAGASPSLRRDLVTVLSACEAGQYAPAPPPPEVTDPDRIAHIIAAVDAEARPLADLR